MRKKETNGRKRQIFSVVLLFLLLVCSGMPGGVAPTWPTTIEALKAQGLEPFSAALRCKECCFVLGRE